MTAAKYHHVIAPWAERRAREPRTWHRCLLIMLARALILFVVSTTGAVACSCSNPFPIQRTNERYADRAVFTARVVQFLGKAFRYGGKEYSGKVLAVVEQRYWGVPWYWPKIVVLDGGFFCNLVMDKQTYLVSGGRTGYGIVDVEGCSRTAPLRSDPVDRRTLDGSNCRGPGGTIIGRVAQVREGSPERTFANTDLSLWDNGGELHEIRTDSQGVFELRHLPAGEFTLDGRLEAGEFASSSGMVAAGMCTEAYVTVSQFALTGKLIRGIDRYAEIRLVGANEEATRRGTITPGGWYYFDSVPAGQYYLVLTVKLAGRTGKSVDIYYPGTESRNSSVKLRASGQRFEQSFDFPPEKLPLVSIPVFVETLSGSAPFRVEIYCEDATGVVDNRASLTGGITTLFGRRGEVFRISAEGFGNPSDYRADHQSEKISVVAKDGMDAVHVFFTGHH